MVRRNYEYMGDSPTNAIACDLAWSPNFRRPVALILEWDDQSRTDLVSPMPAGVVELRILALITRCTAFFLGVTNWVGHSLSPPGLVVGDGTRIFVEVTKFSFTAACVLRLTVCWGNLSENPVAGTTKCVRYIQLRCTFFQMRD